MLQLATWKPDLKVQKQIDEKLEKSSRLHEIIEQIKKQVISKKKEEQPVDHTSFMISAFNSKSSDYKLHWSIIIDSGANIHVCNNQVWFQTFWPIIEENYLYAGNTVILIKEFGNTIR